MPHAVSMPATGFQAIILCGPGSSFPTFTANPDENPKALLPIANRPMVWYPIEWCYRTGITDITLVCPPSAAEAITTALNTNPFLTSLPHPRASLVAPKDLDQNTGTAQILRLPEIRELITSNFVVLPCDLVCELGGDKLLQAWMVKSGASKASSRFGQTGENHEPVNGGLGVWYQTKTDTPVKGEETDFIAASSIPSSAIPPPKGSILPHLSHLNYSMPTDSLKDLTGEKGSLPLRHGLLRRLPKLRMLMTHRDAHIYILPKWVMEFVNSNEHMESIGEDVIGWWAKASWQEGLYDKLGFGNIMGRDPKANENASDDDPLLSPPHSVDNLAGGDAPAAGPKRTPVPPILAYIHPSQAPAPIIRRVDTAQILLQVSLQLAKLQSVEEVGTAASLFAHTKKITYPKGVKPRTTITRPDSLVGDNVTVEEKTSIKESVIGANCQINEGARLLQCVLMDGVVVGKGCKLTRCILGKRSQIGDGSTLTNCEVQENLLIEPKTEDKDNKLMSSSGLEASEQEMQEALQGDETGEDGDADTMLT